MKLRKLEAYGFKSFADKIDIEFGDGITGIVGPNGSGKSNISDAIRWVLGEQNVRAIRGNKIEDVIFKGSTIRRAAGVADVLLMFENMGDMPINFNEIAIQRRIFRTGESEFFINRKRCRLKDITELFADTGIGLGGISIISQNRVDDILKSKPEDRRIFFEETIGITKYRSRKRETLNKLEYTENNLIRAADIINELEMQLKPLKLQAERTIKFNQLDMERRRLLFTKFNGEHQRLSNELENMMNEQKSLEDKTLKMQAEIIKYEATKEQLSKEAVDTEHDIYNQSQKNEEIRQQVDEMSAQIAKLDERQLQGKNSHAQMRQQQETLSNEIATKQQELATVDQTLAQQRDTLIEQQNALSAKQKQFAEIELKLKSHTDKQQRQQQELLTLQKKLSAAQNQLLIAEHDLNAQTKLQQDNQTLQTKTTSELNLIKKECSVLETQQTNLATSLINLENRRQSLKQSIADLTKSIQVVQSEQTKLNQQYNSLETRLQILNRMQQNYEGFARAPKAVLMSKESWRNKICGAVGELLTVPKKFAAAIEIALGSSVQNIVTEDELAAKSAIEYLKEKKLGRVTFLPLTRIATSMQLFKINEVGVIGFANTLVETESRFIKIAEFLLSKTLIVDNIDNALNIAKRHLVRIVTLEGEVLNVGGSISGGSLRQTESGIFSRSGEIDSLSLKVKMLKNEIDNLQVSRNKDMADLSKLNGEIDVINKNFNALQVRSAENKVALKQAQASLNGRRKILSELQNSLTEQSEAINKIQCQKQNYTDVISSLTTELELTERKSANSSEEYTQIEEKSKVLVKTIKQLEIECAVSEQQILRTENQISQLKQILQADENRRQKILCDEKNLLANLSTNAVELTRLNKEYQLTQTRFAYGQQQSKSLYAEKMEKLTKISTVDKDIREKNRMLSSVKNRMHEFEIKISQFKLQISACKNKIDEISMDDLLDIDSDLDNSEIDNRLQNIISEIEKIGAVNPNAPNEFDELNTRYKFLNEQVNDLKSAKSNLHTLIKETDEQIVAQFTAAFKQIQIYFAEIFVKLFGGGSAQLELTNKDDVLNSGVDIMVTLPQKKRQPLSVLSGGERALTVIALLFSFLRFKPSPFCILDEADAPLDEANLIRFGKFLKEFSANTQFILITHRKTTMEFLDRIYGVTVEESGISKILSVQLNA